MNHNVSGHDWPVDQPIPFTVTPLAERLDGIPAPRTACPPWCKTPGRRADWCESERAEISTADHGASLHAYLFQNDGDEPVVAVYNEGAHGTELDIAGVDTLIEDVEAFLPKLRALREQLAAAAARDAAARMRQRCPAAHPDDPVPCDGPVVVTVLDRGNGGADGCEVHAARLLASLEGGRVYPLPDAPAGAAIRVFKAAGALRPFQWLEGGQ